MLLPQGLVLTHAVAGVHADRNPPGVSSSSVGFPTVLSAAAHHPPHGSTSGPAGHSLQHGHHHGHAAATHAQQPAGTHDAGAQPTSRSQRRQRRAANEANHSSAAAAAEPHDSSGLKLIAIGSRQWGNWWDGRGLLKVRIYDFAVYVDPAQASGMQPWARATCRATCHAVGRPTSTRQCVCAAAPGGAWLVSCIPLEVYARHAGLAAPRPPRLPQPRVRLNGLPRLPPHARLAPLLAVLCSALPSGIPPRHAR
jgi:hypothetical protein